MKTKKILLIVLAVSFSVLSFSRTEEKKEVTKEYDKTAQVNKQTTLEIHNKYGKIDVKNWEKNEVQIHVTVKVTGNKIKDAQSYFDRTHIVFKDSVGLVYAKTTIDKEKSFFNWFEQIEKGSFEVNYEIFAPVYIKLNLHNKYGDIFLNEVHGYTQIFLKYGSLNANNLFFPAEKPLSTINIKYGNATIDNGRKLVLNTKYSNIEIQKVTALIAISKYCNYKIRTVSFAVCDSKYDNYKIANIKSLKFTGAYETLKIDTLSFGLNLDMDYGSATVLHLLSTTKSVAVESDYTNIKLNVSRKMSFTLDGNFDYTDFSSPYGFSTFWTKIDDQQTKTKGFCGQKDAESHFSFDCDYGDVKIKNFD
ncbi:MAG: hypothetical protein DRP35_10465 [Candidatus Zixiibacteriota bacterium]|nr:MAG: hypothetical protein DRP35_10465 [candidate division Zixibacteria bacterium]